MKPWMIIPWAIALLLTLVFAWQLMERQRLRAEVETTQLALDSVLAVAHAEQAAAIGRDSAAEQARSALQSERDSLEAVAGSATHEAQRLRARLRATAPPSLVPTLDSLAAAHQRHVSALERQILVQDSTIRMLDRQVADYQHLSRTLWSALERSQELAQHWQRLAETDTPGITVKLPTAVAAVGGAAVAGFAIGMAVK